MRGYLFWIECCAAAIVLNSCVHACGSRVNPYTDGVQAVFQCTLYGTRWCDEYAKQLEKEHAK